MMLRYGTMAKKWVNLGILNKNQSRNEILKKTAFPDTHLFFSPKKEKNHRFGAFGTSFELI